MKTLFSKTLFVCMLSIVSFMQTNAQELLTYTEMSGKKWTAKSYYASNDNPPSDDWMTPDFDDSNWNTIQGPIYRNNYTWADYCGYWVRRHFIVENTEALKFVYLQYKVDDAMRVYLNGKEIFNLGITSSTQTAVLPDTIVKLIHQGDNVLSVYAYDTGGGDKFVDFGLYAQDSPIVLNSDFNSSTNWVGSYDRYSFDNNYIGYKYGRNWECLQTLNVPSGLYHLSANACGLEYYDDYVTANANKNEPLPASLFINEDEVSIPSAFSEPTSEDIYGSYRWETIDGFVPYYVDRVPAALKRGMFKVDVWSYVPSDNGNISFGIHNRAEKDRNRWAAWDNMDLQYCSENEVTTMLDSMKIILEATMQFNQNREIKNKTLSLLNNAEAASTYDRRSIAFVDFKRHEPIVQGSIAAYQSLETKRAEMADSIEKANKDFLSPATYIEIINLNQEALDAYKNGTYDNTQVVDAIAKMNKLMERMSYTYLDLQVDVPGSLGDSILSKVENFVDVKSLKVSGNLNDADLSTIQSRLSQLKEVDMSDVNMINFPNRFFYQHSDLEIVKLPSKLQTIGEYAFYQCYGIRNVDFPSTLTTIGYSAFSECDNLQQVILPEGFVNLGNYAFHSCDNNLYVKLPSTLKTIGEYAFRYNISLKKIDFSEGLTHIYRCAFYECYALNDVILPNSLYFIGDNAFSYDRSLSNIIFNEGLYQIADNAFYDCDALTEVTLPSSLVLANASPFDYCDNLKKVTCLSIEPPYMTDQIPYGLGMEGRELYVPALSINVYKQTSGWDKFQTIKPIDYLPENFTVLGDIRLTLPETIPADYKPNVSVIHDQKGTSYWQYGSLTVNGVGTLSMNSFNLFWDPNYQYSQYNRTQNYCSLVNNSHLRSDNVSVDLYTRNDRWTFISFQFNVKVSDIETFADGTTNWVIRRYDGQKRASGEMNDTWVRMTADDILNAGEGYIIQSSRYVDNNWQEGSGFRMNAINDAKKNNIFNSTDATISLNEYESEFAHNRSWNLVGNPYPCYYDTRFMDFNAPITVWNMNNNTYTAYSPSDDSYILCPGEAFFVQRPVDNGIINFAKEGRQTNRSVRALESPARAKAFSQNMCNRVIANITISDGDNTDRTRVVLNDNATMDYEMDKDATKFMSSDITVPQIFTSTSGINYAINERPVSDGLVPLNLHIGKGGLQSISLPEAVNGYTVMLEDKAEGKIITLTAGEEYTFSSNSGDCYGRFVLHFASETTGIDNINSDLQKNSAIYSIQGVKVSTPSQKGIYIQNHKKVLINK